MDTRFWGPSGWQLLHLIAASPVEHPAAVYDWMLLLEFILPCKFCRASFHDYIREQPLTHAIVTDSAKFSRWMYEIHNRVNNKLRSQGLLHKRNPPWSVIRDRWADAACNTQITHRQRGWDFLSAVAHSTPTTATASTPMPDAPHWSPEEAAAATLEERNRYNLLTREERLTALKMWWRLLPSILPCAAWRDAWSGCAVGAPPLEDGPKEVVRWLWSAECAVCDSLQCPRPHGSYPELCEVVRAFESSCGAASRRRRTCRASKKAARRRQTRRYQQGAEDMAR